MKDILVHVCRKSDTLIRWGGDEFLLVGRQTDRDTAALLAERIRQAVSAHRFDLDDGDTVRLSCSIGFAFFPFVPGTPSLFSWEQVLNMADRALYHAKQAGRNRWVGVLNAPDVDPAVAMNRKNDDLEQLASKGIIELNIGTGTPSGPDRTHRPLELLQPQVVGQLG
jgi:predicted signal transduction protein with EAL and GGDEF domain